MIEITKLNISNPPELINIKARTVVFCDGGEEDWNKYFKKEFEIDGIVFDNIIILDTPKAFEESFSIFMFDWGGMSLGNSMFEYLIRELYELAEENPSKDFVLLSIFTKRAYEDMIDHQHEKLENIYTIDSYIKLLKNR
jgi:hypothetical protein